MAGRRKQASRGLLGDAECRGGRGRAHRYSCSLQLSVGGSSLAWPAGCAAAVAQQRPNAPARKAARSTQGRWARCISGRVAVGKGHPSSGRVRHALLLRRGQYGARAQLLLDELPAKKVLHPAACYFPLFAGRVTRGIDLRAGNE